MTVCVADDTLGRLARRQADLFRRVAEGTVDADQAMDGLQLIIEGKFASNLEMGDTMAVLSETVRVIKEDLPYANEKTDTNRAYPSNYKARPAQQQANFWKKHYKKLDDSHVEQLSSGAFPDWADGWLVCPKPTAISGLKEISGEEPPSFDDHWRTARVTILNLLKKVRKNFRNWLEGKLGPEYSRLTDLTAQALERLCKETPGDFLVIPFQSGFHWRGCSVRHVRVRFEENEFGMCTFLAGCLLASHPERITADDQLYLDCSGEERVPNGDGDFSNAPGFRWSDGELHLGYDWVSNVDGDFGSASCSAPVSAS
ncbi:hypothetical protein HY627_00715 [Candidatus Uhrbacteria bacterium]|nr:hypothetical protein [Candidatus Uhrbacteria bacterium]